MKLLAEIKEKDFFPESELKADCYTLRKVANAVLVNEKHEIALLFARNSGFYVLPGGKIEENEDFEMALRREILEETGYEIDVKNEIGMVIAYEEKLKNINISYTYLALARGEQGSVSLTEDEKKADFELKWMTIDQALDDLKNAKINRVVDGLDNTKTVDYIGSMLLVREEIIIKEVKKTIENGEIWVLSS